MENLSYSAQLRRERILDAAQALLLRAGLRGATMEAIARDAQVAKPTLYSYFSDKETVFSAVAERLFGRLREVCATAFAVEGDATSRIVRALSDKHVFVRQLLADSPHAEELSGSSRNINGPALADLDGWIVGRIAHALAAEGHADAQQIAELLFASADGIASHAKRAEDVEPAIRLLVERLIGRAAART